MDSSVPTVFAFEGFVLDIGRRRLTGPDGSVHALPSRAFDVLAHLVQNRARVVSKDELMRAIWSRVVVEENNLNQAIYGIRKALGDSRESAAFIATVPGRGYQWVAATRVRAEPVHADASTDAPGEQSAPRQAGPEVSAPAPVIAGDVESVAESPAAHAPAAPTEPRARVSRRWLLAAGGAAAVVTGGALWRHELQAPGAVPSSIAVLPFRPLTASDANEAVELGITETMINRLSELPGIVVAPLSSVRRYSKSDSNPLDAGRTLAVAAVLDGNVQIERDRLRLTARLLDVETGRSLWSGAFDESLDDFFRVQESLATKVVQALSISLSGEQQARLVRRDTADPEAWQLYMNARFQYEQRTEDGFRRAIVLYEAAAQQDPEFALAYTGLAETLAALGVFNLRPPPAVFPRSLEAARKAVQLDGSLAEAHAALGHVAVQYEHRWHDGIAHYRRALALKPTLSFCTMLMANCHLMQGQVREAIDEARRAQRLEPMSLSFAANLGMVLTYAGQYDAAYDQLAGLVEAAPQAPLPRHHFARLFVFRGEPEKAIALLEGFAAPAPGSFSNLARAYGMVGRRDDALRQVKHLEELGQQGFGVGHDIALILLSLGEREHALDALERAVSDHSQMVGFIESDPGFEPVRADPRYRAFVRQIGL